jgi:hypothetical protein
MTIISTQPELSQSQTEATVGLFDNWFDPIEAGLRERVRELIQAMFEGELDDCCRERATLAVQSRRAGRPKRSPA